MTIKFDTKSIAVMILETVVFLGIVIGVSSKASAKIDKAEHNIDALQDSIEVIQTKNGDLYYEKESLILEKKELEKHLDISKKEVRELEKKLNSDLAYIADLEGQLNVKPAIIIKDSLVYVDNTPDHYKFSYDDKWLKFNGLTKFEGTSATTTVSNINIPIPIRVGLTDEYTIFVKSDNPYISFTDIQGAAIDKSRIADRSKRWNVGIQVGIGVQYGLINKSLDAGPYVGVGLSYGIGF